MTTTIPVDREAIAAIFDLAREGRTQGTLNFINRHAAALDTVLGAFEQQAQRMAQAQGQPPAATPPAPAKEPFDPHTPAAQASRDQRKAKRLAEQAARKLAEEQGQQKGQEGGDSKSPPD